jgi:hypothetical protein
MLLPSAGHRLGSFIGLCISLLRLVGDSLLLLGADKVHETENVEHHGKKSTKTKSEKYPHH